MSFDSTQPPAPTPGAAAPLPPQPTPVEKPRKSIFTRWWFWAIVVIVVAVVWPKGGGDAPVAEETSTGQSDSVTEQPAAEEEAAEDAAEPAPVPVGTAAEAGNLAITVTKVETGVPQVGSEIGGTLLGEKAQGQFVLVHVAVENVGTEAEAFSDMNAKVYDAQRREFEANSAAGLYIEGNDSLFGEINPGNTLQGVLVYDIPADASAEHLEYKGMLDFLGEPVVFALK